MREDRFSVRQLAAVGLFAAAMAVVAALIR